MTTVIDHHVDQLVDSLKALEALMMQPESLHLLSTHQAMERLHAALPLLSNANIAFAHLCERDGAGRLVGANHPVEYLTKQLGLPRADAFSLLNQAKTMFGEVEVPTPPSDPLMDEEEREKQAEEEERRKEEARKAKERARKAAAKANAEKKRIIERALMQLNEHSDPGREEIYAQALEAAETMSAEELRKHVNTLVKRANRKGRDYEGNKDPLAAFKKRTMIFGEEDSDGGSWGQIYFDKASRAAFEAALAAGESPGANLPPGAEDKRTRGQRRFDQLRDIVGNHANSSTAARKGIGTVVMTLTLEDLMGADAYTEFATNTSVSLTALDIVRLGLAGDSFALQLDSCTGVPLSLGRARLASVEQKLVLLAMQQVCAWTGCTKPGVERKPTTSSRTCTVGSQTWKTSSSCAASTTCATTTTGTAPVARVTSRKIPPPGTSPTTPPTAGHQHQPRHVSTKTLLVRGLSGGCGRNTPRSTTHRTRQPPTRRYSTSAMGPGPAPTGAAT